MIDLALVLRQRPRRVGRRRWLKLLRPRQPTLGDFHHVPQQVEKLLPAGKLIHLARGHDGLCVLEDLVDLLAFHGDASVGLSGVAQDNPFRRVFLDEADQCLACGCDDGYRLESFPDHARRVQQGVHEIGIRRLRLTDGQIRTQRCLRITMHMALGTRHEGLMKDDRTAACVTAHSRSLGQCAGRFSDESFFECLPQRHLNGRDGSHKDARGFKNNAGHGSLHDSSGSGRSGKKVVVRSSHCTREFAAMPSTFWHPLMGSGTV